MFGLVKASRLRKSESERDEWKQRCADHAEQSAKDIREQIERRHNWFAIAESRLVAVLLLRDRLIAAKSSVQEIAKALTETAMAVADKAQERDNALLIITALNESIANRDGDLLDIEHILEAEQPPIETAIIRPSSTNRLRWRVNDDDGKALCQSSTGYATANDAGMAFARAAYMISLDHRAPEDDRITRIRDVLTREQDVEPPEFPTYVDAQGNEHGEF